MSTPARTTPRSQRALRFASLPAPSDRRAFRERVLWSCIAVGTFARLIWPLDFEWKGDEKWMFEKAQRVAHGVDGWPWIGMPSGVGMENPGGSVWFFAALAHVTQTPPAMTFAVMLINVLALWGFAA